MLKLAQQAGLQVVEGEQLTGLAVPAANQVSSNAAVYLHFPHLQQRFSRKASLFCALSACLPVPACLYPIVRFGYSSSCVCSAVSWLSAPHLTRFSASAQILLAISLAAKACHTSSWCAGCGDHQQAAHHHSQAHGLDSGCLDK